MVLLAEAPPDGPWKTASSGFGIDTVRLRGPATTELMAQLPEKRYTQLYDDITGEMTEAQRSGYTGIAVKETLVRVKADLRTGTPEVAIEYSAPSVLVGHNRDPLPLPLSLLRSLAETVHDALGQELTGLPDFEQLRLLRVDVDRDFTNVRSIPMTLGRLLSVE